jgi:hypothetical protein
MIRILSSVIKLKVFQIISHSQLMIVFSEFCVVWFLKICIREWPHVKKQENLKALTRDEQFLFLWPQRDNRGKISKS